MWPRTRRPGKSHSQAALDLDAPPGSPRPDPATYDSVATFLETELGPRSRRETESRKLPLLHRLTRTEYQNSVRDLLALDALPKGDGFRSAPSSRQRQQRLRQHRGPAFFVSPTTMERLSRCGAEISRLAVGDPEMPVMVNIHRLHPEQLQEGAWTNFRSGRARPGGSHVLPCRWRLQLQVDTAGAARDAHQIEITIDGERCN